jgi:hypothetical protein
MSFALFSKAMPRPRGTSDWNPFKPSPFGNSVEEHRATPVETIAHRFRDAPKSTLYLGASGGASLIGIATLIRETAEERTPQSARLRVYVSPAVSGKGIGGALMAVPSDFAAAAPGRNFFSVDSRSAVVLRSPATVPC